MKTILITGASRGIGKATAKKFLENGWCVIGTYFKSLDNIKDLTKTYSERFIPVGPYDLASTNGIEKLVVDMKKYKFDAMFLNAGVFSENDDFVNFDINEFNRVMNCNFYSQLIIPIKLQNNIKNGGAIVLMSSNDAYSGAYSSISYSVSKTAVISVAKCLSVNFGVRGIRVNSIAPGAIDTDMNTPEQVGESPKWTPLSRVAQPYEVSNVVYFLCGDESSFVNGENITIDGGYGNVSILLKKEMESSRIYGGYKSLIKRYDNMKKGETIISLDVADSGYAWVDNPSEIEYLNCILRAQSRGVKVYRYIALPDDKISNFKNHNEIFLKYKNKFENLYIISKEELLKKYRDVYVVMGNGCDVYIDNNGNKHSFIDSYSDDNSVGVLTDDEKITTQLYEKLNKLFIAVKEGKIKTL